MSGLMDFVGNQWLVKQYQDAADLNAKGRILSDLVENLQLDGLSLEEAVGEIQTVLTGEAQAQAALFFAQNTKRLKLG